MLHENSRPVVITPLPFRYSLLQPWQRARWSLSPPQPRALDRARLASTCAAEGLDAAAGAAEAHGVVQRRRGGQEGRGRAARRLHHQGEQERGGDRRLRTVRDATRYIGNVTETSNVGFCRVWMGFGVTNIVKALA